jgi:hypothetical protein
MQPFGDRLIAVAVAQKRRIPDFCHPRLAPASPRFGKAEFNNTDEQAATP